MFCFKKNVKIFHRLGILDTSLRLKEHTHTFVNKGGRVAELDFRYVCHLSMRNTLIDWTHEIPLDQI